MSKLLYFLAAFAEAGLSVLGIRTAYEHPPYTVRRVIAPGIETRAYPPRTVAETPIMAGDESEAFGRLFRYITGANRGGHLVAMTVPVEQARPARPITVPVEVDGAERVMRFYLPPAVAADAPVPADPLVHVRDLPATTIGVVRYAGGWDRATRSSQAVRLREALGRAGITVSGEPITLSYDPPFTIPFMRRNEIALQVAP